jgi:hypothetical protein
MTLYSPGAVVLVRFPFSLLHTAKKRPAVVISPSQYFLRYGDLHPEDTSRISQALALLLDYHYQP